MYIYLYTCIHIYKYYLRMWISLTLTLSDSLCVSLSNSGPRHNTQRPQISQKQDVCNRNLIMKTMCPRGFRHDGFVATDALGHKISKLTS